MDRLVRAMKVCGVAVLLAVSLLSAGHPALSQSDSVSFLSTPLAAMLSDDHSLAAVLKNSEGKVLLYYAPEHGTGSQTPVLDVWAAPALSALTVDELLTGAAPAQTALSTLEGTHRIGGN